MCHPVRQSDDIEDVIDYSLTGNGISCRVEGGRQVSTTNGFLPSPSLKEGESTTLAPEDVLYLQADNNDG